MAKHEASILFLGKKNSADCQLAFEFCQQSFAEVTAAVGEWGEPLPDEASRWNGDYIISYLSRWVVPASLIAQARVAAINFHPASPDYPGIGCNNFALYENAAEYGVTCHHMAAQVDAGPIIAVRRFPLFAEDTVASVLKRTYAHQLVLFYSVVSEILQGRGLPTSKETWTRAPITRKEFNRLGQLTADMSPQELATRIRATSYGPWQPTIAIGEHRFKYIPPE